MQQNIRGIWLAMVTVACWAILPITLQIASRKMDAYTVTWYRFVISAALLAAFLRRRAGWPRWDALRSRNTLSLLLVATAGLVINYVLYLVSLRYASPTAAGVVTQLGPILLMLGGIRFYGERLSRLQWIGVALIVVGLFLFFNRRLAEVTDFSGRAGVGTLILLAASVAWAAYGLAQKALVGRFSSQQVLVLIYAGAAIFLLGFSAPGEIRRLSALELAMLLACGLNTLIAYGALAEALEHSGATRVGAVLAVSPVAALFVTWMTNRVAPGFFEPDLLNAATIVGAFAVAVGSAISAAK